MGFLQSAISRLNLDSFKRTGAEWVISDDDGNPVLPTYSVIGIPNITSGGQAVSAPVEENSFQTYNKTTEPMSISMDIAFQGTNAEIQSALDKVSELKESTEKFSIITPYYEFQNFTLENYGYSLTAENGYGSVAVSLSCVEVKEVAAAYTSVSQEAIQENQKTISETDAANPSDVSVVDTGRTATVAPTTEEEAAAEPKRKSILASLGV